ncbi:hypothetical protein CGCS363_v001122 [Colletotrichum siamense]|uniref:uncharacterized protein n=1 Tax=Colletotrichum siamense TaxID=690259 RepID=UPI0018726359|nr:uncharacterized protein CGCS363_v001122 [Colletotrichum siamense]KAF5516217.1 hypothetical protein CGCS363_v001122 [Colletotrichum siamense]
MANGQIVRFYASGLTLKAAKEESGQSATVACRACSCCCHRPMLYEALLTIQSYVQRWCSGLSSLSSLSEPALPVKCHTWIALSCLPHSHPFFLE